MAEEKLGAAGNDTSLFTGPALSAFNTLAGGEDRAQQALALANALSPKLQEFDPYIAAMKYFTGMTEAASKPGATVFGAAAQAFKNPVDYLQEVNQINRKIKASAPQTAISIAQALKPPKTAGKVTYRPASEEELKKYGATSGQMGSDGRFYDLSKTSSTSTGSTTVGINPDNLAALRTLLNLPNLAADANDNVLIPNSSVATAVAQGLVIPKKSAPKEGVEKYLQQDRVLYMTEENAKAKLKLFGVEESDAEFADLLALITTDDDELIGRPVIQADAYLSFYVPRAGEDSEFNVITRTPGGSAVPAEVLLRNEELKKLVPIAFKQRQVMNDLLPTLESAMQVIFDNPNTTGAFQEFTLPIRSFLSSAFGFSNEELSDQLLLNAISNKLAPQMRPVGSGSTSDMEFKAYKSAILTMGNTGKANYLTLYSLDKTTRNAAEELQLRKTLLSQNKSETYIANEMAKLDKGIYEKFEGIGAKKENGDVKYSTVEEYVAARNSWKNSLRGGSVILNKDEDGRKIFPNAGTFIIKGWGGSE